MTTSSAPEATRKPHLLARLGRWCARRRKLVVFGIWIPAFIALSAASGAAGTNFRNEMKLPNGEARDVFELLESVSEEAAGFDAEIVFYSPTGVNSDEINESLSAFFARVDALEGVDVASPFDSPEPEFSDGGTVGVARLKVTERTQEEALNLAKDIQKLGEAVPLTLADGGTP